MPTPDQPPQRTRCIPNDTHTYTHTLSLSHCRRLIRSSTTSQLYWAYTPIATLLSKSGLILAPPIPPLLSLPCGPPPLKYCSTISFCLCLGIASTIQYSCNYTIHPAPLTQRIIYFMICRYWERDHQPRLNATSFLRNTYRQHIYETPSSLHGMSLYIRVIDYTLKRQGDPQFNPSRGQLIWEVISCLVQDESGTRSASVYVL